MVEMPQAPRSAPGSVPARIVFVDGLRLLAALQMVQGHTLDALLDAALRHGSAFRVWTFTRGLTSVAFLVTAGLAFALATATREGQRAGRPRRLRRAVQLLLLGYLMRAPLGVWWGDAWISALRNALAVDVLQCIGVSLVALELSCAWVVRPAARAWLGAGLGALCFALGPMSERLVPAGPWLFALNYLSARAGSLFPLFPWAGYVFWGLALGQGVVLWTRAGERASPEPATARARHTLGARLALAGGGFLACAALSFAWLGASPARVSPAYALLKLGLVTLVSALLAAWLEGRQLPRLLRQLSSETLFLYVSHVLVLYAGHVGLSARVGPTLALGPALGVVLVLLIACSAGALGYRRAQRALRGRGGSGTPRPQPSSFPG